jgi:putative RNA 2'-phosphotransferase
MSRPSRIVKLSKRLSYLLRHHPEQLNLELDAEGYTTITAEELAERMGVQPELILRAVRTDPKGRFDVRDGRIRANYGHSVPVGRRMWTRRQPTPAGKLPQRLYHGTAPRRLDSIMEEGLRPMGRQLVHLSTSPEAAARVGSRHCPQPAILEVDVPAALEGGVRMWRAGPQTVLSTRIPPRALSPRR